MGLKDIIREWVPKAITSAAIIAPATYYTYEGLKWLTDAVNIPPSDWNFWAITVNESGFDGVLRYGVPLAVAGLGRYVAEKAEDKVW